MKKKGKRRTSDFVRVTLSIPRDIWSYFERQKMLPQHGGNRSGYVRSLIISEMSRKK